MKLWIRLDTDSPRDPRMGKVARQVGVPPRYAFGMVVATWAAMGEHCPDGDLGDVDDALLEEWAGWVPTSRKDAGRFATALRAAFCDASGVDREFKDQQGKLVKRLEKDRNRKRRDGSVEFPSTDAGMSEEIPRKDRGESSDITERNATERSSSSSTPPPARELSSELQRLLENDFQRSTITRFLSALGSEDETASWDGRLVNLLSGRDWPDDFGPAPAELASALGEYLDAGQTTFSAPHVRGYIVTTMKNWRDHAKKLEPHRTPRHKPSRNGKRAAGTGILPLNVEAAG